MAFMVVRLEFDKMMEIIMMMSFISQTKLSILINMCLPRTILLLSRNGLFDGKIYQKNFISFDTNWISMVSSPFLFHLTHLNKNSRWFSLFNLCDKQLVVAMLDDGIVSVCSVVRHFVAFLFLTWTSIYIFSRKPKPQTK